MIDGPLNLLYLTREQQNSILGLNSKGIFGVVFYAQFRSYE